MKDTYIVQLKRGSDKSIIEEKVKGNIIFGEPYSIPHMVIVKTDPQTLEVIQNIDGVISVDQDFELEKDQTTSINNWFLCTIQNKKEDCTEFEHPKTGKNVDIYIVDDGIRPDHVAFNKTSVTTLYSKDGKNYDPKDTHGTRVAGAACGYGYGPAFESNLYNLRTSDYKFSEMIKAFDRILEHHQNKGENNPSIVNTSFGYTIDHEGIKELIDQLNEAGIFHVSSAGNEGNDKERYPACYDSVLSVGAITKDGKKTEFTSYGDWVDVYAPGDYNGELPTPKGKSDVTTTKTAGTSFSSPLTAGVLALFLQGSDKIKDQETKQKALKVFKEKAISNNQRLRSTFTETFNYKGKDKEGKNVFSLIRLFKNNKKKLVVVGVILAMASIFGISFL